MQDEICICSKLIASEHGFQLNYANYRLNLSLGLVWCKHNFSIHVSLQWILVKSKTLKNLGTSVRYGVYIKMLYWSQATSGQAISTVAWAVWPYWLLLGSVTCYSCLTFICWSEITTLVSNYCRKFALHTCALHRD